jgi:hypothetical protein
MVAWDNILFFLLTLLAAFSRYRNGILQRQSPQSRDQKRQPEFDADPYLFYYAPAKFWELR